MCGIVYYKSFDGRNVSKKVLKQYNRQRDRGTEGFGYYMPETNRLAHNAREHRIKRLLKREQATEVLFHHRWPTSTDNVRNACHPFSTKDTFEHNYVMVHNGIVHNDYQLQNRHEDMGIKYVSEQADGRFNDSEALLYDVALYLEGLQDKITAEGSIAFVMIENDQSGTPINLHFARNSGSPLKMSFTDAILSLSSEGIGDNILPDTIYSFNYATEKLTLTPMVIPEYNYTWKQPTQAIGYYNSDNYYSSRSRNEAIDGYSSYSADVELKAYQIANQLIEDCDTLDQALQACQVAIDSSRGKIKRINDIIMSYEFHDPKHGELEDELSLQFNKVDALNEALDILGEWFFDAQAYSNHKPKQLQINEPGLKVEEV